MFHDGDLKSSACAGRNGDAELYRCCREKRQRNEGMNNQRKHVAYESEAEREFYCKVVRKCGVSCGPDCVCVSQTQKGCADTCKSCVGLDFGCKIGVKRLEECKITCGSGCKCL